MKEKTQKQQQDEVWYLDIPDVVSMRSKDNVKSDGGWLKDVNRDEIDPADIMFV